MGFCYAKMFPKFSVKPSKFSETHPFATNWQIKAEYLVKLERVMELGNFSICCSWKHPTWMQTVWSTMKANSLEHGCWNHPYLRRQLKTSTIYTVHGSVKMDATSAMIIVYLYILSSDFLRYSANVRCKLCLKASRTGCSWIIMITNLAWKGFCFKKV